MLEGYRYELEFKSHLPTYIRDITADVEGIIEETKTESGIVLVSSPHTTLGFYLNETKEPGLLDDMRKLSLDMIPEDSKGVWGLDPNYRFPKTDVYEHDCMANPLRAVDEIDKDRNGGRHGRTVVFTLPEVVRQYDQGKLLLGKYQGLAIWEMDGRDGNGENPERIRSVSVLVCPGVIQYMGRRTIII